jgi:hypothetical protein
MTDTSSSKDYSVHENGSTPERKQGEEATLAGAEDEAGIDCDIGRGRVIGRQLRSYSCEP